MALTLRVEIWLLGLVRYVEILKWVFTMLVSLSFFDFSGNSFLFSRGKYFSGNSIYESLIICVILSTVFVLLMLIWLYVPFFTDLWYAQLTTYAKGCFFLLAEVIGYKRWRGLPVILAIQCRKRQCLLKSHSRILSLFTFPDESPSLSFNLNICI